jgi:HEAT repeat protein
MTARMPATWMTMLLIAMLLIVGGCGDEDTQATASPRARAIAAMENGTTPQRIAAAKMLGKLGDPNAAGVLMSALDDSSIAVRRSAIDSLKQLGVRRAAGAIAAQLKHPADALRVTAAEALTKLATPRTADALAVALGDSRMMVRTLASDALVGLGEPAIAPVSRVLARGQLDARISAAQTLGKLRDPRAGDALAAALSEESSELRLAAASGLAELGDGRAVAALLALLENPLSETQEKRYRQRIERTPSGARRAMLIEQLMRRHSGGLPGRVRYPHEAKRRLSLLSAEADHIRELVETPLSRQATAELETVLAARTGWDKWSALSKARRQERIHAEAGRLAATVAENRQDWGGSLVEQYFRERHGAQWWASLSDERKAEEIQRASAQPIRRELESRRRQVRGRVARALARVGTAEAVEKLLNLLNKGDRDRRELLRREVRMAGNAAAEALASYAADRTHPLDKRRRTLELVRTIHGGSAPETLAGLLNDPADALRELAGLAIAEDPTPAALPWVVTLLNAESTDVRRAAVRRLGSTRYAPAVPGLCDALSDPDPTVRFLSADALGAIGDPNATPALLAVARKAEGSRSPAKATMAAVRAVGDIGQADALPLVMKLTRHRSGEMRAIALVALGGFDEPAALEAALKALGRDDASDRKAAIWALKKTGRSAVGPLIEILNGPEASLHTPAGQALFAIGKAAVGPLMDQLESGSKVAKLVAIRVIGERRPDKATGPLVKLLESPDPDIRASAAWALGRLGDASAIGPLEKLLKDADPKVVKAARVALWKLR